MVIMVNKYKFGYSIFQIVFLVCMSAISFETNGYFLLAVASTLQLVIFFYFNLKVTGEILNFSTLFLILLYVFHFGQIILLGFFPELTHNQQITLLYFSEKNCVQSMRLITVIYSVMAWGIMISSKRKIERFYVLSNSAKMIDYDLFRRKALMMIGLSFPVKVVIDAIFFVIAITQGERIGVIWLSSIPNFIVVYGNLSIIGFCLLIVSLKYDEHKQMRALVLICTYYLLLMLSGRRSENVVYVCILVFFYVKTYKRKIGFLKVVVLVALAYLFLAFLFTIVYSRAQVGAQALTSFTDTFKWVLKEKNIFVESLREYGNTGYTAICVDSLWLNNYAPTYGTSLLYSCSAIIPNIGGVAGWITELGNFAVQLKRAGMVTELYQNIGGSLIAEILFNFGRVGSVIVSFILGLGIGIINKKSQALTASEEFIKLSYYIPAIVSILYWVRDVFGGGIRTTVWGLLFVYISKRFITGRKYETFTSD